MTKPIQELLISTNLRRLGDSRQATHQVEYTRHVITEPPPPPPSPREANLISPKDTSLLSDNREKQKRKPRPSPIEPSTHHALYKEPFQSPSPILTTPHRIATFRAIDCKRQALS